MKKIIFVIIIAAVTFTLSANGQQDPPNQPDGPSEITVVSWDSARVNLEEIIVEFEKAYPEISVNLQILADKEYEQAVAVKLAGGEDIDVFGLKNNAQYSDLASKNVLEPLDSYIKRDNFDTASYGPTFQGVKVNGKAYVLPYRMSAWTLFYNKNLFDEAGVPYPSDDMTWDEFRKLAQKMTSGTGDEKIWGAYFHTWPISTFGSAVQTGSTFVDEDLSHFKEALDFRLALENDGSIMSYVDAIVTKAHYNALFQKGNVAMNVIGDWHINQLRNADELPFDWNIAAMPHPKGVSSNTTWGMPTLIGVTRWSDKKEAAWKFISFVSGKPGAEILASNGFLTAYTDEHIKSLYLGDGKLKPADIGLLMDQKIYVEYPPISGINYIINSIYKEEVELVFAGEVSIDEAFANIRKRIIEEQ